MHVRLPEEMARKMSAKYLATLGIDKESFSWKKFAEVDLGAMTPERMHKFHDTVEPLAKFARGGQVLLKDVDTWIAVTEHAQSPKARSVRQFTAILTEVIRRVEGHRVFRKHDDLGEAWLCYYVNRIEFHEETDNGREHHPAYCEVELRYIDFGNREAEDVHFYDEHCVGLAPEEALARKNLYLENPTLRERYVGEVRRFKELIPQIGRQMWARGVATDDLDGNDKSDRGGWWSSRTNRILLDRMGEPSRVVVDLFRESDKEQHQSEARVDLYFWGKTEGDPVIEDDKEFDEDEEPDDEDTLGVSKQQRADRKDIPKEDLVVERPVIEIPIHPFLATFDMRRHLRLRMHVSNLMDYIYDKKMADKLVLPDDERHLVNLLVSHTSGFKDIVHGKGGGAVILCAGEPGTGKTLTAEVYAESMERPLYSVQCSQLGTDPDALEQELLKVFARSLRWKAVLLLDEADVYVHYRGKDLRQNAIVGVFLRVLEYFNGVMFMTTNRGDLVDDAVISRCIAMIQYAPPEPKAQQRIWEVLTEVMEIPVEPRVIKAAVEASPGITGRDVKTLLKLSKLVSDGSGKPITAETIEFVKRFKPATASRGGGEE